MLTWGENCYGDTKQSLVKHKYVCVSKSVQPGVAHMPVTLSGGAGTMLEPRHQAGMPPGMLGVPSLWLSKLPLTSCHLHTSSCSLSQSWTALRLGKKVYKENKHIFVCSENGSCRIKGICMKSNITEELEAGLFSKSKKWGPKGMHCAPLIYQLLEYPNPLLSPFLSFSYPNHLHKQPSPPIAQSSFSNDGNIHLTTSKCSWLAAKILLGLKCG